MSIFLTKTMSYRKLYKGEESLQSKANYTKESLISLSFFDEKVKLDIIKLIPSNIMQLEKTEVDPTFLLPIKVSISEGKTINPIVSYVDIHGNMYSETIPSYRGGQLISSKDVNVKLKDKLDKVCVIWVGNNKNKK